MSDLPALVRTLARYMRENPYARDSAEGIHRWWLPDGHAVTTEEIEKALEWMTHKQLVAEKVAADGRVRFRRAASDAQLDAVIASGNRKSAGSA